MLKKMQSQLMSLFRNGFFHIFGSSVIAQIGGLISSALVIRFLPKENYGSYVEANNLYSYFAIFIGMGLTNAVMQFCNERIPDEEKNSIYSYSLIKGTLFNFLLFFSIWWFALIQQYFGNTEIVPYLKAMAGIPIVTYFNSYPQIVLRVKRKNQIYSYVNIVYTILTVIGNVVFVRIWNIYGLILATYVANGISSVLAFYYLSKNSFLCMVNRHSCNVLNTTRKREILRYSVLCSVVNFTSTLLVLLDVTCLGSVLSDSTVLADYKVASTIPAACVFIPSCLITYFYPFMVEAYSTGVEAYKAYLQKLFKLFFAANFFVSICLIVFAPLILFLIYGEKYVNTAYLFRCLSVNYFIYSTFRQLFGNAMVVIKKVNVNLIHTIIAGILNVILNLSLIQQYGSIGAAIATVLVTTITSLMQVWYLYNFFKKS